MILKLAPVTLLLLAALVPLCTGTVWGNILLLFIVSGIFFGTISLGQCPPPKESSALANNKT